VAALWQEPVWAISNAVIFGLLVGSFLNVVIYRMPKMLQRSWQQEAAMILEDEERLKTLEKEPEITLAKPASTCPHCGHKIRAWENIPVISYLIQGGKCSSCKSGISIRYPLVELATAIISAVVIAHFGGNWAGLAALLFSWVLIALTMIDADHQILPDDLTLPLLWAGLLANYFGLFVSLPEAVLGAIAGYMTLWSVYWLFKLITGKEGMGYGDFKLLAALGAWMGWQMLPLIIILSSLVGAILGSIMLMRANKEQGTPIPFGPYLAVAGWIALLWGQQIVDYYLKFSGL
jgi:leader peptidase (prepilin peptidase)/N-methyltransferase